jgi:hypothetical protein
MMMHGLTNFKFLKFQSLISGKAGAGTHWFGFRVVPGCFEEDKNLLLRPGM